MYKRQGLRQAIGEHIEDCGQNKYVYVAGNNLVNSVLNEKKVLCEHENIKMQVEVTASVDGERELDIAVMLSNLLDNAVEAQKKITQDKPRSIFLKIFSYENKYSILIKNTVAKSVLQTNPRFITDKTNRYLDVYKRQQLQIRKGFMPDRQESWLRRQRHLQAVLRL